MSLWLVRQVLSWCCVGAFVSCSQPRSRGSVRLPSSAHHHGHGHRHHGDVDPQYAACAEDLEVMHRTLATARALLTETARQQRVWFVELLPGPLFFYAYTRDMFDVFAGLFATTYFHWCCTCAMPTPTPTSTPMPSSSSSSCSSSLPSSTLSSSLSSSSASSSSSSEPLPVHHQHHHHGRGESVVDEHLRVRGVRGLRVADASVIPAIPSVPIAATCMTIGVMAADFIRRAHDDESLRSPQPLRS